MINEFNLAKAFRDKLKEITSHKVVSPSENYMPKPNETYIKQSVANGDYTITISPNDSDSMQGFYQINVYTPIANKEWFLLKLVDTIKLGWGKGFSSNVNFGGQKVSISNVNVSPGVMKNEQGTHLFKVVDVYFTVIG